MNSSFIFAIVLFIINTSASYIEITNPGFELNCYPLDGTKGNVCWEDAIGWNRYHNTRRRHTFLGHINPLGDPQYMNGTGASEGIQCLFVSISPKGFGAGEFGIEQRLSTVVTADTFYTLTVDIGNPNIWGNEYHKGWPGISIYLLAGNEILAEQSILSLEDGLWTTAKLTIYVPYPAYVVEYPAYVGQPLGIRLTNLNHNNGDNPSLNEVLFDNVKLEAIKLPTTTDYRILLYTILSILMSIMVVTGLVEICKSEGFDNVAVRIYKYEEKMVMLMSSIYERFFYTRWYEYNGRAPAEIYELNIKYNNSAQCTVCFRKYKKLYRKEDILHCGHRFHTKCLRKWELRQFKLRPFKPYRCPMCRTPYHWKQKWQYVQN